MTISSLKQRLCGLLLPLCFATPAAFGQSNAYSWGQGVWGKLGNNATLQQNAPVAVVSSGSLAGKRVTALAGGSEFSVALTSDGLLRSWGYNSAGQLGNGTGGTNTMVPVAVNQSGVLAGKVVTAIAAGSNHALVLASDGNAYAWGDGESGKLGDGTSTDALSPVAVQKPGSMAGKTIVAIAAGSDHSLFLTSDGLLFSCGFNANGELGDGTTTSRTTPVPVLMNGALAGLTVTKIAAGRNHCTAVASNGRVYCWGLNADGQLGDGTLISRTAPVAVSNAGVLNGKTIVDIDAGYHHNLALDSQGKIHAWGSNVNGMLGDGTTLNRNTPVSVSISPDLQSRVVAEVSAGRYHSMLRTTDGSVFCWGNGTTGVLGNGGTVQTVAPTLVPAAGALAGKFISRIAAGGDHSLALSAGSEIVVETTAQGDLTDGTATIPFGLCLAGRTYTATFTLRNTGLDTLNIASTGFSGAGAGEYTVTTAPASSLLNGGQTTLIVRFSPQIAGTKTVLCSILSNDIDEASFDISLTSTVILPSADEDGDGVTNEAELNLAQLGFNPFQSDTALRQLLHANARGLGLYQASDMQTLAMGDLVLQRNAVSGLFTLKVEFSRSTDLLQWSRLPGTADLSFPPGPANAEFFRVLGVKP